MPDPTAPRFPMELASPFDEQLLREGPLAFFTLDSQGRVRLDAERTRECWLLTPVPAERDIAHFVLTDRATGVRMYALVAHPALATCQPRADAERFPDYASAIAETVKQWAVAAPQALDGADEEP